MNPASPDPPPGRLAVAQPPHGRGRTVSGRRLRPVIADGALAALLGLALACYGTNLVAACPFDSRRPGYLAVAGAVPVRFQPERSPVRHLAEPACAAAAPKPPATAPAPAPHSGPRPPVAAPAATRPAGAPPGPGRPKLTAPAPPATPPAMAETKPPAPLPLEPSPPGVRPEDFLPFFQSAGTSERPAGATFVLPPAVRSTDELPVSSATYTQTDH